MTSETRSISQNDVKVTKYPDASEMEWSGSDQVRPDLVLFCPEDRSEVSTWKGDLPRGRREQRPRGGDLVRWRMHKILVFWNAVSGHDKRLVSLITLQIMNVSMNHYLQSRRQRSFHCLSILQDNKLLCLIKKRNQSGISIAHTYKKWRKCMKVVPKKKTLYSYSMHVREQMMLVVMLQDPHERRARKGKPK